MHTHSQWTKILDSQQSLSCVALGLMYVVRLHIGTLVNWHMKVEKWDFFVNVYLYCTV